MDHSIMSQYYTALNLPIQDKLVELTKIIDQSSPNKDLQALFPQLIENIFSSSFGNGWGLRTITAEINKFEYDALLSFLGPQGPIFRLCYKLLSDPQLKYELPLNVLPLDLQRTLERDRCPHFYADLLTTGVQAMNIVALMLNPFDYYIFNFALHLINNSQKNNSWENWNSIYFALACDYLMHFLPSDPNVPVLPHISNYTGKVPMVAPLQTANRPLCSPSLLLIPDLTGAGMSNQHMSQTQQRNEVWRSETILQVFIDLWMSVNQFSPRSIEMYQNNYPMVSSSPEQVRIVRVLVKHLHSFSARHFTDSAVRSASLRKYARQIMCSRAYRYIKHLVTTWPLDASFRLVMELWLSLIQPWRYVDYNMITQDKYAFPNHQEDTYVLTLDPGYIQFIAENFPSYTCIFQLLLPRFMQLDLTAYKNAVMLFRLGKVFSQQHLVPILWNLEQAIINNNSGIPHSPDSSFTHAPVDQQYIYNGIYLHKWVGVAKQAISEFNLSPNFEYEPIWTDSTQKCILDFMKRIILAKASAEKILENVNRTYKSSYLDIWTGIKGWLMIGPPNEERIFLEESKKTPTILNNTIVFFTNIFSLSENTLITPEVLEDESLERSSFVNSTRFPFSVTNKLRSRATSITYKGDPELKPITSYESTTLVRMLYQISCRINELSETQFPNLWSRNDIWGYVAREILQEPCVVQSYVKDIVNYQNIINRELPARVSLRRLGSHAFIIWLIIGYILFRTFFFSGFVNYLFILVITWMVYILLKASIKMLKVKFNQRT